VFYLRDETILQNNFSVMGQIIYSLQVNNMRQNPLAKEFQANQSHLCKLSGQVTILLLLNKFEELSTLFQLQHLNNLSNVNQA
jgi:hypothetical protein